MGSCFSRRKKNDATVVHSGSPAKDANLVALQKQQMQQLQTQEASPTVCNDSSTVSQCPVQVQTDGHGDGTAPCMPAERICAVSSVSPPLAQKQDEDEIFLCVEDDDIAIGEDGEARSPKGGSLKRVRSEEEPVHGEVKRRSFKLEEEGDGDLAPNHAVAKGGQSTIQEESGSKTSSFLDGLLHNNNNNNNSSPPENLDGSSWTAMSLDQQQQQEQKQQYMDSLSADFFALKHRYLSSCASSSSSIIISPPFPKQEEDDDEEEEDPSSLHRSSVPRLDHGISISPSALHMQEEEASSSPHRSCVPPLERGITKGFALSPPRSMDPSSLEVLDSRYSSEDGEAFLARSEPILEEEEEDDDDNHDGKEMIFSSSSDESDTFEFMQALSECCSPQRDRGIPEHNNTHILELGRKHGEQPRDRGRESPRLSSSSATSIDDDLPAYVEGQGFHLTAAAKRAAEGEVPLLSMEDIMALMDKDELNEETLMSFLSMAGHRDTTDTKIPSCPPSDVASEASFEFKIGSTGSTPHSTPSTPMLSAGSTPKRVTQLSPLMLTPEEIAEIWGVFELKQQEQSHHFHQ